MLSQEKTVAGESKNDSRMGEKTVAGETPWRPGSRSGKEVLSEPGTSYGPSVPGKRMNQGAEARRKNTISLPHKVLSVDQDLCMLTTAQLKKRMLIGRFRSFFPGLKEISTWFEKICVQKGWKASVLRLLGKGFFLVSTEEDGVRSTLLTGEPLRMKNMRCIFQPWRPRFDPLTEQTLVPTWITLPFFPEELRNQLPMIASTFGNCIYVPPALDGMHVRFCVLLDTSKGVSPVLELLCPEGSYSQEVEYDGIPLRCFLCRSTDHLAGDCPKGNARGFALKKKGEALRQANRGPLGNPGVSPSVTQKLENQERQSSKLEVDNSNQAEASTPSKIVGNNLVQEESESSTCHGRKDSISPKSAQEERRAVTSVLGKTLAASSIDTSAPPARIELACGTGKKIGLEGAAEVIDNMVGAKQMHVEPLVVAEEELASTMGQNKWEKVIKRYNRRNKPKKETMAAELRITRSRSQGMVRTLGSEKMTGQISARKVDQICHKVDLRGKKILEDEEDSLEVSSEDDSLLHSVIPSRLSVEPE